MPPTQVIRCGMSNNMENSVTQHSDACRIGDTLGQLPKAFWCGCWLQPTQPRATLCLGTVAPSPPGPIKHAVGRPRKMERCNGAKENGLLLSSPPFPVLLPPPIPGVHRSPSFAEMWSKIVWGRGGERTGSPGQLATAGERARTCPGFESLSDVMVGWHEYISDPHDALSDALSIQHRREQRR